jgi:hypothetical protein
MTRRGFGRVAVLLYAAAGAWLLGAIIQIIWPEQNEEREGITFVVSQVAFSAAMIALAIAYLMGRRVGLVGASKPGRVGLLLAAIGWLTIVTNFVPTDVFGIEAAFFLVPVAAIAYQVGGIMAGVAILRRKVVPRPGVAVFLVAAVADAVSYVMIVAFGDVVFGPGHLFEIARCALWALIALSITRPNSGRVWLALSFVAGVACMASIFIPF